MSLSTLRERVKAAALEFAWEEWAQMGVSAAPGRRSAWAQDPEALVLFTLDVARDDPRLFDELLDWLVRNEPIVSARRLRALCEGTEDERLAGAALEWVAAQRHRPPPKRALLSSSQQPEPLFRGLAAGVRDPDPAFLEYGFVRSKIAPSGKSLEPDLRAPINFAFRLRHLLGVSTRAEAVRFLLTTDAPNATVATIAASAAYAKRNVQEALTSLAAARTATVGTVGPERRYGIDRVNWANLLGLDADNLPRHRDWRQLLSALRTLLRWLARPDLDELSDYLQASQARDLLEQIRQRLSHAGITTTALHGGESAWEDFVETIDRILTTLRT